MSLESEDYGNVLGLVTDAESIYETLLERASRTQSRNYSILSQLLSALDRITDACTALEQLQSTAENPQDWATAAETSSLIGLTHSDVSKHPCAVGFQETAVAVLSRVSSSAIAEAAAIYCHYAAGLYGSRRELESLATAQRLLKLIAPRIEELQIGIILRFQHRIG